MVREAWAFWVREPGAGEIRPVRLPAPGPEDVLVRTLHSGISRGTEALVFDGRVPADQRTRMRAPFQEGDFPGPVKYGYLSVGVVEQGSVGVAEQGHGAFVLDRLGLVAGHQLVEQGEGVAGRTAAGAHHHVPLLVISRSSERG